MTNATQNIYSDKELMIDDSKVFFTHDTENNNISWKVRTRNFELFNPDYTIFKEAYVLPGFIWKPGWKAVDVIYDKDKQPIKSARHESYYFPKEFRPNLLLHEVDALGQNFEHIRGQSIYGGFLYFPFGHFITESISRLWVTSIIENISHDTTFIFHVDKDVEKNPQEIMNRLKERKYIDYFNILGISEKQIKIVSSPLICEELLIPEPAIVLDSKISKQMRNLWEDIRIKCTKKVDNEKDDKKGKKIYFSRATLKYTHGGRKLINEEALEKFLIQNGFEIVHPHDLESENEKIALLNETDVLLGLSGSGLHNAAFMKSGTSVVQIVNNKIPLATVMQHRICLVKNIKLYSIVVNYPGIDEEWEVSIEKVKEVLTKIGIIEET